MSSKLFSGVRHILLASAALTGVASPAQTVPPAPPSAVRAAADRMAAELVARLTVDEKIAQLVNTAPAIPRLGIPAYNWWTESLHGAIGTLPTTNFPEPIGLAATFDAPLVHAVAGTISTEVRALHTLGRKTGKLGKIGTGLDTWSPNINIFRDPRWGRGQETYGEDPYLTAQTGVAFITGMQGNDPDLPDVIATPKHFAVHSGPESTRHAANVFISRHDLEDTYLPAFRAAIVEAKAGSIMCAYNRIDGQPACASDLLLKEHLRGAWGFTGYVVSDCDAVKDIADNHKYASDQATAVGSALQAGVDNECNVATVLDLGGLEDRYRAALKRGLITEGDLDRALVRLFSARYRNGDLPGVRTPGAVPVSAIGTPASGALALKAAEESMVLLKNDGTLPLAKTVRVAVIGPLGDATRVLRGNYSGPLSAPPISVVEGLRRVLSPAQVTLVPFGESITDGDRIPESALRSADGKPGLTARYYNPVKPPALPFDPATAREQQAQIRYLATPVLTRREPDVGNRSLLFPQVANFHRTEWTGFLVAPESGPFRIGLSGSTGTLDFAGRTLVDLGKGQFGSLPKFETIELVKGQHYPVRIVSEAHGFAGTDLVWKRISRDPALDLKRAAAEADMLVAVVGLTSDLEAEETGIHIPGFEGGDKTTLDLPADQIALLEQARATGKKLIVVAMNGSPINLAWAKDNAAGILEAWYPGQSGGLAVANLLAGKSNPAGRLPLTFYRSVADLPPFGDYAMQGRTYRYFAGTPVYPFGHGLSYASFAYGPVTAQPLAGGAETGLHVSVEVRNTGARAGDEVSQLYLNFPAAPGVPRVALRGYRRVTLQPGERRTVSFDLSPRDLSSVAPDGVRRIVAGRYRISVGSGQPDTGVATEATHVTITNAARLPE
jgi:beta-glucosidase